MHIDNHIQSYREMGIIKENYIIFDNHIQMLDVIIKENGNYYGKITSCTSIITSKATEMGIIKDNFFMYIDKHNQSYKNGKY